MNRRTFLLGLAAIGSLPRLLPHTLKDRLDIAHLRVELPRLIFFPDCALPAGDVSTYCHERPLRVVALARDPEAESVSVEFSNGRHLRYPSATPFQSVGASRDELSSLRERMGIKRLSSWILAGLQEANGGLWRLDYELLQRQQVLDRVTLAALYDLLDRIQDQPSQTVTWEPRQGKFVLG